MRVVHGVVAGSIAAVAAAIVACGSTTSSNAVGGLDSGAGDVTQPSFDAGLDSGSGDDGGQCSLDADLLTDRPPDAALDDAGASVGTCIACAQTTCAPSVSSCNGDCPCNAAFACIYTCLGGVGNSILTCASQCVGSTSSLDLAENALLTCVARQCTTPCALSGLFGGKKDGGTPHDGGTDGGADSGETDGSTDASNDAKGD